MDSSVAMFIDEKMKQTLPEHVPHEVLVSFSEQSTVLQTNINTTNSVSIGRGKSNHTAKSIIESNIKNKLQQKIGGDDLTISPMIAFQKKSNGINSLSNSSTELIMAKVQSTHKTTQDLIDALKNDAEIKYVEPNYIFHHTAENADDLWGIYDSGENAGVDADKAWAMGATGKGVVIANIDTGVDRTHKDLTANIWKNPNEINCTDGKDDDNNGFIDDCWGWDFALNNNDPSPGHFHGTHTAGTMAAVKDNKGVVGVAPDAKIMALKVFDDSGQAANMDDIIHAIDYAALNGADIISMSLGGEEICIGGSIMAQTTQAANAAGITLIAASGNSGGGVPGSPASCPKVYGVGATDKNKELAEFSSYWQDMVDFVAPGVFIESTMPNNEYGTLSGTSMAAPNVAGIVALMLSHNPNLSPDEVGQLMCDQAEDLGDPGRDEKFGCGLLNAERILLAMGDAQKALKVNPSLQTITAGDTPEPVVATGGTNYSYQLVSNSTGIKTAASCTEGANDTCAFTKSTASGKAILTVKDGNREVTSTIIVNLPGFGDDDDDDDLCTLINQTYDFVNDTRFAPAINFFSGSTLSTINAYACGGKIKIEGGDGSDIQYIWKDLYVAKEGGDWKPHSYTFEGGILGNGWGVQKGEVLIDIPDEDLQKKNYVASYICTWADDQWKCGCRDATCTGDSAKKWSLQVFGKK